MSLKYSLIIGGDSVDKSSAARDKEFHFIFLHEATKHN